MIFHVLHLAMPILVEPSLKSWSFLLQKTCFTYTTRHKPKAFGLVFNKSSMLVF
jgi:hypothetical protein